MKQKRIFKIIAAGIVLAAIAVLIYNRFSYKERAAPTRMVTVLMIRAIYWKVHWNMYRQSRSMRADII